MNFTIFPNTFLSDMKKFFTVLLLLVTTSCFSQSLKKIQQIISEIPASTKLSINITNANTGKILYSKNDSVPMIPASNTKLFTTATALYLMGNDHIFETKFLTEDLDIYDSRIDGNLYVKGYGNSVFTENDLDTMILKLKDLGINEITGDILADGFYYDSLYHRDEWIEDEKANVKLPPISALVINKNQIIVSLNSNGKVGSKLNYSIRPEAPFINVNIKAKVTKLRTNPSFKIESNDDNFELTISGGLRKKKSQSSFVIDIDNPTLFFALLLKEKLMKNGIEVKGKAKIGRSQLNLNEIASNGIPINELISLINKHSNNYLAECLFKAVGAFFSGEQGNSFYATQAVLTTFAADNVIDNQTAVVDGSGISRFNTITTGSISRLLYKIYKDKTYFNNFYGSLSIYGIDGTLRSRSNFQYLENNFRGKTGTLNGVTALSGYLKSIDNTDYIVSIIMEYKDKSSFYYKNVEDRIIFELSK